MISFYLSLISLPVPNRFSLLVVSLLFIKFLFPNNFLLLKKFTFSYYTAKCFILTLYSNLLLQQSTFTLSYFRGRTNRALISVSIRSAIPDTKNHNDTPRFSVIGPAMSNPKGIVAELRLPIKEKARPIRSGGMVSCI